MSFLLLILFADLLHAGELIFRHANDHAIGEALIKTAHKNVVKLLSHSSRPVVFWVLRNHFSGAFIPPVFAESVHRQTEGIVGRDFILHILQSTAQIGVGLSLHIKTHFHGSSAGHGAGYIVLHNPRIIEVRQFGEKREGTILGAGITFTAVAHL